MTSSFDTAKLLNEKKLWDEALLILDKILRDNPNHFTALIERSVSHQKLKKYDEAVYLDLLKALEVAVERKKKENIGLVYYRLGVVFYLKKDYCASFKYFKLARQNNYEDGNMTTFWIAKVIKKLKDLDLFEDLLAGLVLGETSTETQAGLSAVSQKLFPKADKPVEVKKQENPVESQSQKPGSELKLAKAVEYPPQNTVRKEFFESSNSATVAIYIKNIPKDSFKLQFLPRAVEFEFKTDSGSDYVYELDNLAGEIDPKKSSYTVFGSKLELVLVKVESGLWKSLVVSESASENKPSAAHSYPSSSQKNVDWGKIDEELAKEKEEEGGEMALFQEIFKNADPDTRRAMQKSYVESAGTALSTNWKEVSQKTYDIDPPSSMVAKKWGE